MRSTSIFLSVLAFYLLAGVLGCEESDDHLSSRDASPDLDTCTYIDAPLSDILNTISGIDSASGEDDTVQGCFCTSAVRSFLESAVFDGIDGRELEYAAEAFVVTSPGAKNCVYPPNSKPACSRDDVCGFTCTNGFELGSFNMRGQRTDTCACPSSKTVCNGQCGSFPDGCPSQAATPTHFFQPYRDPSSLDRSSPSSQPSAQPSGSFHTNLTPTGSLSDEQVQQAQDAGCAPNESLCGAYAPRGRRATECVDTQTSLESCGGCMMSPPPPFFSYDYYDDSLGKRDEPKGVDCTALEGVSDVSCAVGKCVVQACEDGWTVAPSGDHCDPVSSSDDDLSDEPARQSFDKGIEDPDYVPSSMPFLQPPSSSSAMGVSTPESGSADTSSAPDETPASSPSSGNNGDDNDGPSSAPAQNSDHGSNSGPAPGPESGPGIGNFVGSNGNENDAADADASSRDGPSPTTPNPGSGPGTHDNDAVGSGSDGQDGSSPGGSLVFGGFAGDHPDDTTNPSCLSGSGDLVDVTICGNVDMGGNMGVSRPPEISGTIDDLQDKLPDIVDTSDIEEDILQSAMGDIESSADTTESTVSNLLRTSFIASLPLGESSIGVGESATLSVPTETDIASLGLPTDSLATGVVDVVTGVPNILPAGVGEVTSVSVDVAALATPIVTEPSVSATISYDTDTVVAEASSVAVNLQENAANIGSNLLESSLNALPSLIDGESGNLDLPTVTSIASLGLPTESLAQEAVDALTGALDTLSLLAVEVPSMYTPTATVTVPAVPAVPAVSTIVPSATIPFEALAAETSSIVVAVVANDLLDVGGNGAADLIKDAST